MYWRSGKWGSYAIMSEEQGVRLSDFKGKKDNTHGDGKTNSRWVRKGEWDTEDSVSEPHGVSSPNLAHILPDASADNVPPGQALCLSSFIRLKGTRKLFLRLLNLGCLQLK